MAGVHGRDRLEQKYTRPIPLRQWFDPFTQILREHEDYQRITGGQLRIGATVIRVPNIGD